MRIYLYIFVFFIAGQAVAQEDSLFDQATQHYADKDYEKAVSTYEKILSQGKTSAEVYFNLANAHYKLDQIGPSVYFYNKALQLAPNDDEIQTNLAFANERAIDEITPETKTGWSNFVDNLISTFSYNTWAVIAIVFVVVFMLFAVLYYFTTKSGKKRFFFVLSALGLIIGVLSVVFAYQQYDIQQNKRFAIVFAEESTVHTGPNHNSEEAFTLHEGTKLKLLDSFNGYTKIKLADGKKGWISEKSIKEL